jgi:hypothetical protein
MPPERVTRATSRRIPHVGEHGGDRVAVVPSRHAIALQLRLADVDDRDRGSEDPERSRLPPASRGEAKHRLASHIRQLTERVDQVARRFFGEVERGLRVQRVGLGERGPPLGVEPANVVHLRRTTSR